jgi:probable HAF family extracellular repeat protein
MLAPCRPTSGTKEINQLPPWAHRVDNSGSSFANNINPQGTVVVGQAETDAGFMQAFIWQKGDMHISNLGTLKADGTGTSTANAVSDDGKVVAGTSSADSGNTHAAIWKISYANPEPEEKPGINPEPEEKPDTSAEKTPGTTPEYKPGTTRNL